MNWRKIRNTGLKTVVIVAAYWYLFQKIKSFENWDELLQKLNAEPERFVYFGLPVLCMTLVNLSLRALTWKSLTSILQPISFKRAVKAILLGITGGSFTPARFGDWLAKSIVLEQKFRKKGIFVAAFGHIMQSITMIIPGIVTLYFYSVEYTHITQLKTRFSNSLMWIFEAFVIAFVILLPFVTKRLKFPRFPSIIQGIINTIAAYSYWTYIRIIAYNTLKNIFIYLQLYLLLRLFGIPMDGIQALIIIPTFYLSLSFVPGVMFADLGVIGAFSILIIGKVFDNYGGVLLATMCIWITNVGLPLLGGSLFIALYGRKQAKRDKSEVKR